MSMRGVFLAFLLGLAVGIWVLDRPQRDLEPQRDAGVRVRMI